MDLTQSKNLQLVDAVQRRLEADGIIQSIRLQLKSHVLQVLKNSKDEKLSRLIPNLSLDNSNRESLLRHTRDLLEVLNLPNTLASFDKECGLGFSTIAEGKKPVIANLLSKSPKSPSQSPKNSFTETFPPVASSKPYQSNHDDSKKAYKYDEEDSNLLEVSKDEMSMSSSFVESESSFPENSSPARKLNVAPAISFKPLGKQSTPDQSFQDSTEDFEVPEEESNEAAMSSSFEPESPSPKSSIFAPNSKSSDLKSFPPEVSRNSVEVKSLLAETDPTTDEKPESPLALRATVRSYETVSSTSRFSGTSRGGVNNGDDEDDYDFDSKGPVVSLHSSAISPPVASTNASNQSFSPTQPRASVSSAWSTNVPEIKHDSFSSARKSNNQEEEEENEDDFEVASDDDDFSDYNVNEALGKKTVHVHTANNNNKVGSKLESDDEDEFEYKPSTKSSIKSPSKNPEEDYGDDFEDEIEEDEMSVGEQQSDEDDEFGGSYKPTASISASKSLFHSKSGSLPTISKLNDENSDDGSIDAKAEKKRLAEVEARMKQLEQQDLTGNLNKLKQAAKPAYKSNQYNDEDEDDISVASDNIDEMDFSVGEEDNIGQASSNSEGSDLYSFLDNKPSTSSKDKKLMSSLSNSGDFSMSEQEVDSAMNSESFDFTTRAQPPDRKR